jgi:hypothetical protein
MKKFIIFITLLCPTLTIASNCETTSQSAVISEQKEITSNVPKFLKGATITIKTSDGRESSVSAEKFKVVPRKQQFIISKIKQVDKMICTSDKNRLSVLAGRGPKEGLDRSSTSTTVTIKSRVGDIGGVQYQRMVSDKISIGTQVQSNSSAFINIGLDF